MRSPSRRKRTKRPKSRVGKKGSRQKHETRSARSRRSRSKRSRPPRKGVRYGQQGEELPDRNKSSNYLSNRSGKLSSNIAELSSSSELTLRLSQLEILSATSFLINKTNTFKNLVAVLDVKAKIDNATMTTGGGVVSYNVQTPNERTDEKISLQIVVEKYDKDPVNSRSKATISLQPTTLVVSAIDGMTKNETKLSLQIGNVTVTATPGPSSTGLDDNSGSTATISLQPTTLVVSAIDGMTKNETKLSLPIGNVTATATRGPSSTGDSLGLDSLFDTVDEYYDMIFTGLEGGGETLLKETTTNSLYPLKMNVSSSEQGGYNIQFDSGNSGIDGTKQREFFKFSIDFNLDSFQFENCTFIIPLIAEKIPPVLNDIMKEYVTTPIYRGLPAMFSKFGMNVFNAMKDVYNRISDLKPDQHMMASNMNVNWIHIARVNAKEQNKTNKPVLRIQFLIARSLITRIIGMTGQEVKVTLEKMMSPQKLVFLTTTVKRFATRITKPQQLVANDQLAEKMNGQIQSEGINVKRTLDASDLTPYVMKRLKADPTVVASDNFERRKALYESLFGRIGLKRREQETRTDGSGSSAGVDVCLDGDTPCDSNLFFSDDGSIELRFKMG